MRLLASTGFGGKVSFASHLLPPFKTLRAAPAGRKIDAATLVAISTIPAFSTFRRSIFTPLGAWQIKGQEKKALSFSVLNDSALSEIRGRDRRALSFFR
jgi:hypothetical protein